MASLSRTAIANLALSKLGETRITDLDDTSTTNKGREAMAFRFDHIRDLILQQYPWRFAMALASLPADADAPPFGYDHQYQLPSDCIRLVNLADWWVNYDEIGVTLRDGRLSAGTDDYETPFQIYGQKLHTDEDAPLKIRYIKQITDTGLFPSVFSEVLACALAADAAEEITQSQRKQNNAVQMFEKAIKMARMVDALQMPPRRKRQGNLMMSRYG